MLPRTWMSQRRASSTGPGTLGKPLDAAASMIGRSWPTARYATWSWLMQWQGGPHDCILVVNYRAKKRSCPVLDSCARNAERPRDHAAPTLSQTNGWKCNIVFSPDRSKTKILKPDASWGVGAGGPAVRRSVYDKATCGHMPGEGGLPGGDGPCSRVSCHTAFTGKSI